MTWHWRKSAACDLDELLGDINPQMKDLEGELGDSRPSIMSGYPRAAGAVVAHTAVSHTGSLTETTLKSFDFRRGAISSKGGIRVMAAGTCQGAASTKSIKLKWGGYTLCTLSVAAGNNRDWIIFAEIFNIDVTTEQRVVVRAFDALSLEQLDILTVNVDTL
jgi:hypothetical protein